jgi:hypothetical protein
MTAAKVFHVGVGPAATGLSLPDLPAFEGRES